MEQKTVAVAGGSGFIGRAIVRRMAATGGIKARVLTRNPDAVRLDSPNVEFARADIAEPASLAAALNGADAIVDAVQFEGYPVENPARGQTFERVDYGGVIALLAAAKQAGVAQFIYISGAAANEASSHPGFRAKGRAERAIRESGLSYTTFRPSLVYGPEDKVVSSLAKALKFAPIFGVPGTGRQKVQPVLVDDLAACVTLAIQGRGRNGTYEVGGPDLMTFDEMMRIIMNASGHRRPLFHIPEGLMRAIGGLAEKLPKPMLSRDAVTFVTADNACDIGPLREEFGINLTPARVGMAYLSKK
ncbi:MAG: NAD(P)H-binding protein [Candidatus Binatus sp.]|uniref:NAD(P)H-binding protein n=1 Tax=Candidatus Binatus sp. TaxID=2811406 RepID=UPI002716B1A1|nr:NAD(P)H-binding protein [Candidatus Binatus sp.]MDO8430967.1 NAD(P)H-binding protein [Candidatus Binatus sp.]